MAEGTHESRDETDAAIREMFTLEHLLRSEWYAERLASKQQRDAERWTRHVKYLREFLSKPQRALESQRLRLKDRLALAERERARVAAPAYRDKLAGFLSAHPCLGPPPT